MKLSGILTACVFLLGTQCFGQTNATCTFSYFTPPSPYNVAFEANGINHYGTVVGQASSTTIVKAFIKPSSGSVRLYSVPNATHTVLNKRNYYGTSVGYYAASAGSTGLILSASGTRASVTYPKAYSTVLTGINKWNSIVGAYSASYGAFQEGFKYRGGSFLPIRFPGAAQTVPMAINDNGVIVGQYVNGNLENPPHGFLYQGGNYKTLDIAGGGPTELQDINNSGEIVAAPNLIYKSGAWKKVVAPNSSETFVYGVNDLGKVTGVANYRSGPSTYTWKAFTAQCR